LIKTSFFTRNFLWWKFWTERFIVSSTISDHNAIKAAK